MKTVKMDVTYKEQAGRLELFIRWIWSIPVIIVLVIFSIVAAVLMFVQFFHVLFMGKRNKMMFEWTRKYIKYQNDYMCYMYLTDERCPIMPED